VPLLKVGPFRLPDPVDVVHAPKPWFSPLVNLKSLKGFIPNSRQILSVDRDI